MKCFLFFTIIFSLPAFGITSFERVTCYSLYNSIYSIDVTASFISVEYVNHNVAEWNNVTISSSSDLGKTLLHFEHSDSGLKADITFKPDGNGYGEGYISDELLVDGKEHAICLING
jgi:hypothetical protein